MDKVVLSGLAVAWGALSVTAEVVVDPELIDSVSINEIMASNDGGLETAAGGKDLDWIELVNTGADDVDVTGWYLYDSPKKAQTSWAKIEGSCVIPAGGYKVVWADKDYNDFTDDEAYARIGLSANGEPLFLAKPDGTKVHELEFPAQMENVSYGIGRSAKDLVSAASPAQIKVGEGAWTDISGTVGMTAAGSAWSVTYYPNTTGFANLDDALAGYQTNLRGEVRTYFADYLCHQFSWPNAFDGCGQKFHDNGAEQTWPWAALGDNSYQPFTVVATAKVRLEAGTWGFCMKNNGAAKLTVSGNGVSGSWNFNGDKDGYAACDLNVTVLETGVYQIDVFYHNRGNRHYAVLELSARAGGNNSGEYPAAYELVGHPDCTGISAVSALSGAIAHDVTAAMKGVSDTLVWKSAFTLPEALSDGDVASFAIRYADGYEARLNGTVISSAAANGPRTVDEILTKVVVPVESALFTAGENVLEVTGVNDSADDSEFFLAPELSVVPASGNWVYFAEPTPGAANTTSGTGPMTPEVSFSEPHGYKTAAFELTLSCPDDPAATIYYTTDGSSPSVLNGTRYAGPITIDRTTVVRAAAPATDTMLQRDTSATYLFLADILEQSAENRPAGFPASGAINGQRMDYGFRWKPAPESEDYARLVNGFTNGIATISIVTDTANLFDPVSGIYVNATGDGRGYERTMQIEQIDPVNGASNEFSAPAGLRIRGAASRGSGIAKHSFRVFFRKEYGLNKLEFPLFGDEGTDVFDRFDLRTEQNYSWHQGNDLFQFHPYAPGVEPTNAGYDADHQYHYNNDDSGCRSTFVAENFSRDAQGDLGEPRTRSRTYHLFLNGVYWGLYQSEERAEANYAESYFGGDKEEYDAVKTDQNWGIGATSGTLDRFNELWNITVNEGYDGEHEANFLRVQGRNSDGTPNPDYPVYLDVTNLIDYIVIEQYIVSVDGPTGGNVSKGPNNISGIIRRDGRTGFKWLLHDAEHALGVRYYHTEFWQDVVTCGSPEDSDVYTGQAQFNPATLHAYLLRNPTYKRLFADRAYALLTGDGALSVENSIARFNRRAETVSDAIVAEAARWGKGHDRAWWLWACDKVRWFIRQRNERLIAHYRYHNIFPKLDAPTANLPDGTVLAAGETLHLTPSAPYVYDSYVYDNDKVGTNRTEAALAYYYTTDGTDPCRADGSVNPAAIAYGAEGVDLSALGTTLAVRTRAYNPESGEWSPLTAVTVTSEETPTGDLVPDTLRIGEVCVAPEKKTADGVKVSWVELVNIGETPINLGNYELRRTNRGKELAPGASSQNLPALVLGPGARTLVYMSEDYGNKNPAVVDGLVVVPSNLNCDKYPTLAVYRGKEAADKVLAQWIAVPRDLPPGMSTDGDWIYPTVTPGAENDPVERVAVGPSVGPRYGVVTTASDLDPLPMACEGQDYAIALPVNGCVSAEGPEEVSAVTLVVSPFGGGETELPLSAEAEDPLLGQLWTGVVPAANLPAAGGLVRFAVKVTTPRGTFRAPSFRNGDDDYAWYGTIVTNADTAAFSMLPCFDLFASSEALSLMDRDFDDVKAEHPLGARVGLFDRTTGAYYDNVRIDLRGGESAAFAKKPHGLKLPTVHPLVTTNPFDGEKVTTAATSFTAEYADPSFLRQTVSMKAMRLAGVPAPFHYPVRLSLNGEFYQLAFHSNRFTDELVNDYYGLDADGYAYKSVGTFTPNTTLETEAKLTSDKNLAKLRAFEAKLPAVRNLSKGAAPAENPAVTAEVVRDFDLPAWINYLAAARITGETDDTWANLGAYWDSEKTGTWRPLPYDLQMSFGQYYRKGLDLRNDVKTGLRADDDTFKSHPFYGGFRVQAHYATGATQAAAYGNAAIEAIYQSPKFRRLYLRRLRTLMDTLLGAPGEADTASPLWRYLSEAYDALKDDAKLDRAKYSLVDDTKFLESSQNVWTDVPASTKKGREDLWNNYVVPRRTHLFVTHAATAANVGYGEGLAAGIPSAQSPLASLKDGITVTNAAEDGSFSDADVLVIANANGEAVDLSGWTLGGGVVWTIPAGTVVDAEGEIYVVKSRKSFVVSLPEISDQVVIGNAKFNSSIPSVTLTAADGTQVFPAVAAPDPEEPSVPSVASHLRILGFAGNTPNGVDGDTGEYVILTNLCSTASLDVTGVRVVFCKAGDTAAKCNFTLGALEIPADGTLRLDQADYAKSGWSKITNNELAISLIAADGTVVQSGAVTQKDFPTVYGKNYGSGDALELKQFGLTFVSSDWKAVPYVAP